MITNVLRALIGFTAAWVASAVVGFGVGCFYGVALLFHDGQGVEFLKAAVSGQKNAFDVFIFFGATSAFAAAAAALAVIVVIGVPLFAAVRKRQRMSAGQCIAAGLAIALAVAVLILGSQFAFGPLIDSEYWYCPEFVGILIAGPAATLLFWSIVRPGREA
jgi:hypothetical protein